MCAGISTVSGSGDFQEIDHEDERVVRRDALRPRGGSGAVPEARRDDQLTPSSDVHADEIYRRDLVKALTERVLTTAVDRARR